MQLPSYDGFEKIKFRTNASQWRQANIMAYTEEIPHYWTASS